MGVQPAGTRLSDAGCSQPAATSLPAIPSLSPAGLPPAVRPPGDLGVAAACFPQPHLTSPRCPPPHPRIQGCHLLSVLLEELGIAAAALHSHKPQRARLAALDRFKGGAVPVLLATDVAARGLDIPTVDLVINYDLPQLARDYVHRCAGALLLVEARAGPLRRPGAPVHGPAGAAAACRAAAPPPAHPALRAALAAPPAVCRVGRTARAGRAGWSLSFVTQYDIELVQQVMRAAGLSGAAALPQLALPLAQPAPLPEPLLAPPLCKSRRWWASSCPAPCPCAHSAPPLAPCFLPPQIEALVGQQLAKYELEEAEVLKGITKVRGCWSWEG